MGISPKDFEVSEKLLRQRLQLPLDAIVFPFGYEGLNDDSLICMLQKRYDVASLYFRTRPDYIVFEAEKLYLVEAKQRTKNVEAIQLFFNKCLERMGIPVVYSFPDVAIRAELIPINKVVIPENYKENFEKNLKHLFLAEGIRNFSYVRYVNNGSGDAFVPIDENNLLLLSNEAAIQ